MSLMAEVNFRLISLASCWIVAEVAPAKEKEGGDGFVRDDMLIALVVQLGSRRAVISLFGRCILTKYIECTEKFNFLLKFIDISSSHSNVWPRVTSGTVCC